MSRREEVDAKLLHTALSDWPSADEAAEYRHLSLTLADERDRLAAENAELRKAGEGFKRRHNTIAKAYWETCAELTSANATLDALREAIQRQGATLFYVTASKALGVGLDAQPKETTDDAG